MVMVPTGPGTEKKVSVQGLEPLQAWLLPGGKGFVIRGEGKDGNPVLAVVGPEGGRVAALPTEDCVKNPHIVISPEGDRLAYPTKSGQLRIVQTAGGDGTTVPTAFLERSDTFCTSREKGNCLSRLTRSNSLPVEGRLGRPSRRRTRSGFDSRGES
jgi:hypothetical protein